MFLTALQALAYLAYGQLPVPMVVMGFELHFLALTGQAPRVDACLRCNRPFTQEASVLDVAGGGALCAACARVGRPLSHGARRILLRVPKTRFQALEKLPGHPDWPEAAPPYPPLLSSTAWTGPPGCGLPCPKAGTPAMAEAP